MPVVHANSVAEATTQLGPATDPVVVVPVYNGYEDAARCFASLLEWTPTTTRILVVDDCGTDRRPITLLDQLANTPEHLTVVLHRDVNGGFVAACNDAFAATGGSDVVLVNSDVVVGPEWFERLTAAAVSSNLIATASTLTNHGSILSVPVRNRPDSRLPRNIEPADAARRVASNSLQLRPTIPTAIGHCVYIKRLVLDVVGTFDSEFGTGYGEEVDFSQRAVKAGFRHCCADDVFTFHRGGTSFGEGASEQQLRNEDIVNARYPWYRGWVVRAQDDEHSPLALALDRARIALTGLTIAIDGTCLGSNWSGTQAVTLESIKALSELLGDSGGSVRVLHTPAILPEVAEIIDRLPHASRVLVSGLDDEPSELCDIIYRPYQVNFVEELRWLRRRGRRLVVNQLDLIAWSNPTYFRNGNAWLSQREFTRLTLATADGVAFISDFARREVAAEQMIPAGTPQRVVYCGTTSVLDETDGQRRPPTVPADERPFLLVLGTTYHHKNRVFALRMLAELRRRGWDGRLVLAGGTPPYGNSLGDEALTVLRDPSLTDHVITLGELDEREKAWVYSNAALALYPTCSEGFGLIPFESARRGLPVLSSRQGSLDEVLPTDIITLDTFDVGQAAAKAWDLLHDPKLRTQQCTAIDTAAAEFTWERTAAELLTLFDETLRRDSNRTAGIMGETGATVEFVANPRSYSSRSSRSWTTAERQVERLLELERLKRLAIPEGSRRQDSARRSANWIRRQSRRS